jgi:hypothetical protein
MKQTEPTNEVHENQCKGLMENLRNQFVPTASAICGVKTEHLGLTPFRNT